MSHSGKKHKAQEHKRHPKHYQLKVERVSPTTLADCLVIAIEEKALSLEEFEWTAKNVIRRCNDSKNKTE